MAKLVDVLGLGPSELARGGSSPSIRTFKRKFIINQYTQYLYKIAS